MTTTYDPQHELYSAEADVRHELTRVFDICQECRRCVTFCPTFPTLFDLVERHDDRDAGRLTPAQQDLVTDACFQCARCVDTCPYTPDRHESAVDFSRLVLRARAMQHANGHESGASRRATRLMARSGVLAELAIAAPRIANLIASARPGSIVRRVAARIAGISSRRPLPPHATERFSSWFRRRPERPTEEGREVVTVFPTCLVEFHEPAIGRDLVAVYERNGIDCTISTTRCCGAPWLHSGDIAAFVKTAEKNTAAFAREIRRGQAVVVAQPACHDVIVHDYERYVRPARRADAELVAAHTFDASAYPLRSTGTRDAVDVDTGFRREVHDEVVHVRSCSPGSHDGGFTGSDLMETTGARVTPVPACSGSDALWSVRAGNEAAAGAMDERFAEQIEDAGGDAVAGDCHIVNLAIRERVGTMPMHPLHVVARAYGDVDLGG